MNKNNDIIIKKLVFKIIQDKNIRNSNITKQLNFFLKTKFETVLQSMQNKFSTHPSDLVIEKLNIDIDDIVTNGMLSEKKFMDSFCEKFNDLIETNYSMNHENFNFDTKYEYVISCFENLCKQPLDERENKTFFEAFNYILDRQPNILQESFDAALDNKVFFENFFKTIPKETFSQVINVLRTNNSKHFSHVFTLFNDTIFHHEEKYVIPTNHTLQHLNLNERQVNFIKKEIMNNQNHPVQHMILLT